MSFVSSETSIAGGKPVMLYEFSRQAANWRYTSAGDDISLGGIVYTNIDGLQDDGVSQSGDASRDTLTITAPISLPVAQSYLAAFPSTRTRLALRAYHRGDTDAAVAWVGYISSVKRGAIGQCSIVCESNASTYARPGVRLAFGRGCPYTVFDRQCGVDPEPLVVIGSIVSLDGQGFSAAALSAQADGYYTGGFVRFTSAEGFDEYRGIDMHSGNTATLFGGTAGMAVGMAVRLYPGDDYTLPTCRDRFNNQPNFGGYPGMPGKNPFDGSDAF